MPTSRSMPGSAPWINRYDGYRPPDHVEGEIWTRRSLIRPPVDTHASLVRRVEGGVTRDSRTTRNASSRASTRLRRRAGRGVKYIRAKRGGDLVGIILVGSGARRTVTAHSDIDLIVLVKGPADGQEMIRVGDRLVDIRYGEHQTVGEDLAYSPVWRRYPEGRILYDHEDIAAQLIAKAAQRFRQGPPAAGIHERIRLKAECLHWLGKVEDLRDRPNTAQYLLQLFFEECVSAFFRIRGLWFTAPVDTLDSWPPATRRSESWPASFERGDPPRPADRRTPIRGHPLSRDSPSAPRVD